jgi:hypothetical protein
LAAAPVEREHQLAVQALAERVLCDQALKLGDQLGVPAHRQVGLRARLHSSEPLFFQPFDLGPRERLERQVRQRWPTPQPQRLVQPLRRLLRPSLRQRPPPLIEQPLEVVGVELPRPHAQPITRRCRQHGIVTERLAQP